MKIGLFTDSHYYLAEARGNRRPILSLSKIKEAMEYFKNAGVDMCICMGDLTDSPDIQTQENNCLAEIISLIKNCRIPFYVLPGNHDYIDYSSEDFFKLVGCSLPPYTVETDNYNFIMLDANYRSDFRRFDVAGVEWTDSNLPPFQVEYLKNKLHSSEKPCIVCVHENLDKNIDKNHIINNAHEIREIIENSQKVDLVLQGHYHPGSDNIINAVRYITIPAMCEGKKNRFALLELDKGKSNIAIIETNN